LRRSELPPSPMGERKVRCSVQLSGTIDEHWRRCFRLVQMDDTGFFRFRLDIAKNVVTFSSPDGEDSPDPAFDMMRLETLVSMVNRRASGSS
jgi:hypothetical protein